MGTVWSSVMCRDEWTFTEDELQARYFQKNHTKLKNIESTGADETERQKRESQGNCAYMMPSLLAIVKDRPNLRILDVGCGSGQITTDFAELCPFARVIGMDVSGAVLSSARVHAEKRGVENVTFVEGNVYDMPAEWTGAFDVVYTHQAVAHFPERVRGVRDLVKVTRGGGIVCMREGDLRTARFGPRGYEDLEECFAVVMKVHEANGGAADAGRRLKAWAVEAGVKKRDIVATQSVGKYDTPEGRKEYGGHWPARCTQGVFAERAMELEVSVERLRDYALGWRRWIDDENGFFAMLHGEVIARVT